MGIRVLKGSYSIINMGGVSVPALVGGALGGYIVNPQTSDGQGVSVENLYVDPTGPAALEETATTVPLLPGQAYTYQPGQVGPLWVNAATPGHKFSAVLYQSETPNPAPVPGPFPPSGPTTLLVAPPSYLYQQYQDDDDLQAFVASYNALAQNYVDTFNALNLPVYGAPYPGFVPLVQGLLLDWVGAGLYGMPRPALASGESQIIGPFNTYQFNTWQLNEFEITKPNNIVVTTDDIYRRILTWHYFKGDGKYFNIRWFKRRIMRFCTIADGGPGPINQTNQISVTFGPDRNVTIRFIDSIATVTDAFVGNQWELNTQQFNEFDTVVTPLTPLPNRQVFKEAIQSGVLELPFTFNSWTVVL